MDERDDGRCAACGGRLTATHMLLCSYPLDGDGRWQRRLTDFADDVVIACPTCGDQPVGEVHQSAGCFQFRRARGGSVMRGAAGAASRARPS